MRYAVIIAGGVGTRLWPMSRDRRPKQLLPLVAGRSLLELAFERLETVVAPDRRLVCAAEADRPEMVRLLGISDEQFLGEPMGRDTLAALAFTSAVLARRDAEAVIGVFTADHLITPVEDFRTAVRGGYEAVAGRPEALLTFGITPTHPATGYGYLELGGQGPGGIREVRRFKEKPDRGTAEGYLAGGPGRYLWNSGMFVFRAEAFLSCLERYEPQTWAGVRRIAAAWDTSQRSSVLRSVYAQLRKTSVDFGIMEPASQDPTVPILAIPLAVQWRDIGSWSSYGEACGADGAGNTTALGKSTLLECTGTLIASTEPHHLVAALGCEDLVIIHTPEATLVCPKGRAEEVKALQGLVVKQHGGTYV